MTIAELIKELEKMPQDAVACVRDGWGEFVPIESVDFMNQTGAPWGSNRQRMIGRPHESEVCFRWAAVGRRGLRFVKR